MPKFITTVHKNISILVPFNNYFIVLLETPGVLIENASFLVLRQGIFKEILYRPN